MKQIYFSYTAAEAHFVKGLLMNEGIHAEVHNELQSGALGEIPMTERPSIWVNDDDETRGTSVVDAYLQTQRARMETEDGEDGGEQSS